MNHTYFNRILHLLQHRLKQGKRLVGLGTTAFWELWQRVEELDEMAQQQRAEQPERQRQRGGGAKKSANVMSRLLVCLLYLRQHWTMQALAEMLGCSEATVWNYIHEMLPYVGACITCEFVRAMATGVSQSGESRVGGVVGRTARWTTSG